MDCFSNRCCIILLSVCCLFSVQESPLVLAGETGQQILHQRKGASGDLELDEGFEPLAGTYHYDVFLSGAKFGRASVKLDQDGDEYTIAVTARTRGVMKYLYRVKYKGEVHLRAEPLQPTAAKIEEKTSKKTKSIKAEYASPDKIVATEIEKKGDDPKKIKTKEFQSESFILDPFSTVFLIRSLHWQVGTAEIFDLFTGTRQYELLLKCTDKTTVELHGEARPAFIIEPETRTIQEPRKVKMSGTKIYLSNDTRKEILKIEGNPKIGRIVADLRRFDPKK